MTGTHLVAIGVQPVLLPSAQRMQQQTPKEMPQLCFGGFTASRGFLKAVRAALFLKLEWTQGICNLCDDVEGASTTTFPWLFQTLATIGYRWHAVMNDTGSDGTHGSVLFLNTWLGRSALQDFHSSMRSLTGSLLIGAARFGYGQPPMVVLGIA